MSGIDVESRRGLVQKQEFGIARQRQREHHPLFLSAGEFPEAAPVKSFEARHGQQS